jgi:hypothetical protein
MGDWRVVAHSLSGEGNQPATKKDKDKDKDYDRHPGENADKKRHAKIYMGDCPVAGGQKGNIGGNGLHVSRNAAISPLAPMTSTLIVKLSKRGKRASRNIAAVPAEPFQKNIHGCASFTPPGAFASGI